MVWFPPRSKYAQDESKQEWDKGYEDRKRNCWYPSPRPHFCFLHIMIDIFVQLRLNLVVLVVVCAFIQIICATTVLLCHNL